MNHIYQHFLSISKPNMRKTKWAVMTSANTHTTKQFKNRCFYQCGLGLRCLLWTHCAITQGVSSLCLQSLQKAWSQFRSADTLQWYLMIQPLLYQTESNKMQVYRRDSCLVAVFLHPEKHTRLPPHENTDVRAFFLRHIHTFLLNNTYLFDFKPCPIERVIVLLRIKDLQWWRQRERLTGRPGAQMSSLLKQGFPHFHVSVPHAMTPNSKTRGERKEAHSVRAHPAIS